VNKIKLSKNTATLKMSRPLARSLSNIEMSSWSLKSWNGLEETIYMRLAQTGYFASR
jgi:hypothetical protein